MFGIFSTLCGIRMFMLADGKPYVRFSTFLGFWVLGFGWVGGFLGVWDNNKPIAC